jgi:hypothetical protein
MHNFFHQDVHVLVKLGLTVRSTNLLVLWTDVCLTWWLLLKTKIKEKKLLSYETLDAGSDDELTNINQ